MDTDFLERCYDRKLATVYQYSGISRWWPHSYTTLRTFVMLLTHRGQNNIASFSQTTFSNACFFNEYEFRFLRAQSTISKHVCTWWPGTERVTSHYLNQWWQQQSISAWLFIKNHLIYLRFYKHAERLVVIYRPSPCLLSSITHSPLDETANIYVHITLTIKRLIRRPILI